MSAGNQFRSPTYIVAKTAQALAKAMLQNNLRHGFEFAYFDIQQGQDGKWYAWFYMNHRSAQEGRLDG